MFYFYPWGEKDFTYLVDHQKHIADFESLNGLSNITATKFYPDHLLDDYLIRNMQSVLFCHDQEPLHFDFYQDDGFYMKNYFRNHIEKLPYPVSQQNLRSCHVWNLRERWILLHTEKNSSQLDQYEATGRYQGAFWWSHALIARDWYRYAKHDPLLDADINDKKLFLVYARAFDGTRSYRKEIIKRLLPIGDLCQIGSFDRHNITSNNSATYSAEDFASTDISLVLETLFEDSRIYLSEKTLRPLACGHPFILVAGPKSLDFIRSYGFETFHHWIDESYDKEIDHKKRLELIIKEAHRLANLTGNDRKKTLENIRLIAQRNRKRFFSDGFLQQVINELKQNIDDAVYKTNEKFDVKFRWETIKWRKKNGLFVREPSHAFTTPLMRHCRLNQGSLEQYQGHQHRLDDESSTDGHDV